MDAARERKMGDVERSVPDESSSSPLPPLIPVEAEDVDRGKRRRLAAISLIVAVVILTVFYIWKWRTDPIAAREAFDGGERLMRAQRYNEAAISLSRTIGLQPGFTEAYYLRGRAYTSLFLW